MNIFIIDDNKQFREDLRFFIENKLGYDVVAEAESGEEFLDRASDYCFDIALMDINMGDLDGFATARKIIWNYPLTMIIAITMYAEKVFLTELIETGFKGFVSKSEVFDNLGFAIDSVKTGNLYFPQDIPV
jgi:DNA-binding NarL/FixJ family response regulator